jgi:hypothetical protein
MFHEFVCHDHFLPQKRSAEPFKAWLNNKKPKYIIVKNSTGQVGAGIEKFKVRFNNENIYLNDMDIATFLSHLITKRLDLIEICIEQHDILNSIYSESLNTLRVITVIDKHQQVNIIGAILRIGADKCIDNFDAGGVSAKVNIKTGVIEGPVIYKSPLTPTKYKNHPITNSEIVGVNIPYWDKVINLVNNAATHMPQIRTIGWDIVLTNKGAFLLEGNHNWDKTHWQKCYGLGLKHKLIKFS